MSSANKVSEFIANHWVSWLIELAILGVVAFFTISETRKTAVQTREMLARYDAAISAYAKERSQAIDDAATQAVDTAKSKASEVNLDNVKTLLNSLKAKNKEDSE